MMAMKRGPMVARRRPGRRGTCRRRGSLEATLPARTVRRSMSRLLEAVVLCICLSARHVVQGLGQGVTPHVTPIGSAPLSLAAAPLAERLAPVGHRPTDQPPRSSEPAPQRTWPPLAAAATPLRWRP